MSRNDQNSLEPSPSPPAGAGHSFPHTRWSVILDAQRSRPEALATFCGAYWFPLYAYARRMNLSVADAEDLTQAFFERLLSRDVLAQARQERGRLRHFLLQSFKNFAAEEWRRQRAQKRYPGQPIIAIDPGAAEERLHLESGAGSTPELEYERAWARELLHQALAKLEANYRSRGNEALFQALRDQLVDGSSEHSYRQLAAKLGSTETALRFAAFKLRQRYRDILSEIVAETVPNETDITAELAYLQTLFEQ